MNQSPLLASRIPLNPQSCPIFLRVAGSTLRSAFRFFPVLVLKRDFV